MRCLWLDEIAEDGKHSVVIPDQHVVYATEANGRTRLHLTDGTSLLVTIGLRQLLEAMEGNE